MRRFAALLVSLTTALGGLALLPAAGAGCGCGATAAACPMAGHHTPPTAQCAYQPGMLGCGSKMAPAQAPARFTLDPGPSALATVSVLAPPTASGGLADRPLTRAVRPARRPPTPPPW
jgi:hypothetical protein